MKNPLIPAGIEPATFRFVAQHLNNCATAVPLSFTSYVAKILIHFEDLRVFSFFAKHVRCVVPLLTDTQLSLTF